MGFEHFPTPKERILHFSRSNLSKNLRLYGYGNLLWQFKVSSGGDNTNFRSKYDTRYGYSQSTAGQKPVYTASDGSFNGNASLNFSGTGSNADVLTGDSPPSGTRQYTFYLVWKWDNTTAGNHDMFAGSVRGIVSTTLMRFNGQDLTLPYDLLPHILIVTRNSMIIDGVVDVSGLNLDCANFDQIGGSGGLNVLNGRFAEFGAFGFTMSDDEAIGLFHAINNENNYGF